MANPRTEVALRQLARAVMADRALGDELLRLAERRRSRTRNDDVVGALRSFLETWKELISTGSTVSTSGRAFSDDSLAEALPPPPSNERLMLILVDVLGFDIASVSSIIGVSEAESSQLLAAERNWTAGQFAGTALIIEDEPLIAAELRGLVESMGVKVAAAARTADQAIRLAETFEPDLLLADYNLDGKRTGLDAVAAIHKRFTSPVVFITGYPERVLGGDDVEPDFVIAKPYTARAVRAAVAHCLSTNRPQIAD